MFFEDYSGYLGNQTKNIVLKIAFYFDRYKNFKTSPAQ